MTPLADATGEAGETPIVDAATHDDWSGGDEAVEVDVAKEVERRMRKAITERDAAIHERESVHKLWDDILTLLGYEKGKGYPGIVGAVEKAINERDSTIATLRAECEGFRAWQPIETAPRDRTLILACDENENEQFTCRYTGIWKEPCWGMQVFPQFWKPLGPPPAATEGQG